MTARERAYLEIKVRDALKQLELMGKIKQVVRPDGQIGYTLVTNNNRRESDTG
jgi:hypothetical protein